MFFIQRLYLPWVSLFVMLCSTRSVLWDPKKEFKALGIVYLAVMAAVLIPYSVFSFKAQLLDLPALLTGNWQNSDVVITEWGELEHPYRPDGRGAYWIKGIDESTDQEISISFSCVSESDVLVGNKISVSYLPHLHFGKLILNGSPAQGTNDNLPKAWVKTQIIASIAFGAFFLLVTYQNELPRNRKYAAAVLYGCVLLYCIGATYYTERSAFSDLFLGRSAVVALFVQAVLDFVYCIRHARQGAKAARERTFCPTSRSKAF